MHSVPIKNSTNERRTHTKRRGKTKQEQNKSLLSPIEDLFLCIFNMFQHTQYSNRSDQRTLHDNLISEFAKKKKKNIKCISFSRNVASIFSIFTERKNLRFSFCVFCFFPTLFT